jgi:hypothetical protein
MATPTPSARREPRRRRSSTPGCSSWTRSHPQPASVLPESAARKVSAFVASSHSGHLHGIGPHNQEPGRTLIPGDGAVGDQMAQNRPVCPTMAATRTPAASPVSTTSWRYGLRRTFRLVTRRSHRPRSTWPDQARLAFLAVTHRHKRTNCLWLEPFQIADSARSVGVPIIVMSGRILCSSVCAAPERSTVAARAGGPRRRTGVGCALPSLPL